MAAKMEYRRQRCVAHLSSSILALVTKRLRPPSSPQLFSTLLSISCNHGPESYIASEATEESYSQRLQAGSLSKRG